MVRVDTNTQTIQNLFKKNTNPNGDIYEGERISIESDFQRGDEETGVWDKKRKQGYIDSLHSNYPTGILTFVKDHGCATAYQEKWATLDGGNRFRAIRDYMIDKFDVNGKKYSELEPHEKAVFDNMLIPCQWLNIERNDPPETIAEMFTRLNTSAKSLSQGELIKAHGWKGNVPEIELAKAIIKDIWNTTLSDEGTFEGLTKHILTIHNSWTECFGKVTETKRCDNIAMICGYIASAKESKYKYFDKRYEVIKSTFSKEVISQHVFLTIITKMMKFLSVISQIDNSSILGRFKKGIPSQKNVAPIWKRICEGTDTPEFLGKLVNFYNRMSESETIQRDFSEMWESVGEGKIGWVGGETTSCKTEKVIAFIEEYNLD